MDQHQIEEGRRLLECALALRGSGAYTIQAAIAELHLREPRDWEEIALLYQRLEQPTSCDAARAAYARALKLTQPGPEKRFGQRRLANASERAEHDPDP